MSQEKIYQNGTAEVNVPATESIAISNYGGGIAKIYYHIITANTPPAWQFQQTLENSAVILGPFAVATIVRIDANNSKVFYDIGSSPDTGIGDADTLNGKASDTASTADTIVARDSSGDITGKVLVSDVAIGTAPLTVTSTTVVPNLNVQRHGGLIVSQLLRSDSEGTIDAGNNASPFNVKRSSQSVEEVSLAFVTDGAWTRYLGMDAGVLKWASTDDLAATGETVYHTGNDTNLAKLNAANVFTVARNDFLPTSASVADYGQAVTIEDASTWTQGLAFALNATASAYSGKPTAFIGTPNSSNDLMISSGTRTTNNSAGSNWATPMTTIGSILRQMNGELIFYSNTGLTEDVAYTPTEVFKITSAGAATLSASIPILNLLDTDDNGFFKLLQEAGVSYVEVSSNGTLAGSILIYGPGGIDVASDALKIKVSGTNEAVYHTGINPSLGSGNAITGSFTTSDAKTITVTDGIITAIV